jgi:hypothetical protein
MLWATAVVSSVEIPPLIISGCEQHAQTAFGDRTPLHDHDAQSPLIVHDHGHHTTSVAIGILRPDGNAMWVPLLAGIV